MFVRCIECDSALHHVACFTFLRSVVLLPTVTPCRYFHVLGLDAADMILDRSYWCFERRSFERYHNTMSWVKLVGDAQNASIGQHNSRSMPVLSSISTKWNNRQIKDTWTIPNQNWFRVGWRPPINAEWRPRAVTVASLLLVTWHWSLTRQQLCSFTRILPAQRENCARCVPHHCVLSRQCNQTRHFTGKQTRPSIFGLHLNPREHEGRLTCNREGSFHSNKTCKSISNPLKYKLNRGLVPLTAHIHDNEFILCKYEWLGKHFLWTTRDGFRRSLRWLKRFGQKSTWEHSQVYSKYIKNKNFDSSDNAKNA